MYVVFRPAGRKTTYIEEVKYHAAAGYNRFRVSPTIKSAILPQLCYCITSTYFGSPLTARGIMPSLLVSEHI